MTDSIREGDWVGSRFKLYARSVREAIFYNPREDAIHNCLPVRCSVIDAWTTYACSNLLFPNLLSAGERFLHLVGLAKEDCLSVMRLMKQIVTHPLISIELVVPTKRWRWVDDPNMPAVDDESLDTFELLASNQQALHYVTVTCEQNPHPKILLACEYSLSRMQFLRSAVVEPPISTDALYHFATLPFLLSFSFSPESSNLELTASSLSGKSFFPVLRMLHLNLWVSTQLRPCISFIGAITSFSLNECRISFITNVGSGMDDIFALSRSLALRESLLFVRLHDLRKGITVFDDDQFAILLSLFLPLATASRGVFRLYLENLSFTPSEKGATEFYPLLRFVLTSHPVRFVFRAQTLLKIAKTHPNASESAAPLGVLLDDELERTWWAMLEPMPQYTRLIIKPKVTSGGGEAIARYSSILRFLFPNLRCLYVYGIKISYSDYSRNVVGQLLIASPTIWS
jgi:hypothetical protein